MRRPAYSLAWILYTLNARSLARRLGVFYYQLANVHAVLFLLLSWSPCWACGFNEPTPRTLMDDALDSKLILFGTLENARGDATGGTTDFVIAKTVKNHPAIKGQKTLRIPKYLPATDS